LMGIKELNEEALRRMHDASPITHVHAKMPPFFLLHGDKDPKVPVEQSVLFQKKMKEAGNVCELLVIPGGDHGMATWDKLGREYRPQVIKWLSEMLK
jgi:dipeptidyl aminopeptidase/acylaminoacyl peptidase